MPFAGISFFIFKYPKILYNKYILIHQKKQKIKKSLKPFDFKGFIFSKTKIKAKNLGNLLKI